MGLDMYLKARRHLSSYDEREAPLKAQISELVKGINKGFEFQELVFEAMYWRKANAIHKWFVDNVQDGKDDCGDYYVDEEQLRALHDTVTKVLDNRKLAGELLPPQSGFFFGSTELDQWYWQDLEYTRDKLTDLLSKFAEGEIGWDWSFSYHSSW